MSNEEEKKGQETTADQPAKKNKPAAKKSTNILVSVGKAAIKEHGLSVVYVTSDGVVFKNESDAKNHALNLSNSGILTVKK